MTPDDVRDIAKLGGAVAQDDPRPSDLFGFDRNEVTFADIRSKSAFDMTVSGMLEAAELAESVYGLGEGNGLGYVTEMALLCSNEGVLESIVRVRDTLHIAVRAKEYKEKMESQHDAG